MSPKSQHGSWLIASGLALQGTVNREARRHYGTVEVDETYIGGKARNMHAKVRRRRNVKDIGAKAMVMGAVERGGKVYAKLFRTAKKKPSKT